MEAPRLAVAAGRPRRRTGADAARSAAPVLVGRTEAAPPVPWTAVHHHGRLHPHHRDPVEPGGLDPRRRVVALWVLCLCALTTGLDMTITNLALPFIGRDLDAQTNGLQWTVDIYNIVMAGLLVAGGALADRWGRRRVFLVGYSLFALASAAAAFSPSIGALVGARGVMAVGAAGVTAPALAIIASMYRPEERSRAIGAFVVFGAVGLVVGPSPAASSSTTSGGGRSSS